MEKKSYRRATIAVVGSRRLRRVLLTAMFAGLAGWGMLACQSDTSAKDKAAVAMRTPVAQGKYMVVVGGCNDCHTVGYPESNGATPESEWLTGAPVGFRGPWGTSYAKNLRLLVTKMSEEEWVNTYKVKVGLPPMPYPSLINMDESDLRAIYKYIKSLGPKGGEMPLAIGPGVEPTTPYFVFEPLHMERLAQVSH